MNRRQFAAGLLAGGLSAWPLTRTRSAESSASPPQLVPQPRYRLRLPSLAFDGAPARVAVSAASAYQGGALKVSASNSVFGEATVLGRTSQLGRAGAGGDIAGIVGFGTEDPPGAATVAVRVTDLAGETVTARFPITILRTRWTVDYITIPPAPPPDPNAPPPPPPPPDETSLLPGVYAKVSPRAWSDGWALPLPAPLNVTGYFGEQRSFNGGPVQGHHGGTDLGAEAGTPVYATNKGTVVMAGLYQVRGNLVVIDHGGGVMSLCGHMRQLVVSEGQAVTKGQVIGYVGSTGLSTGPHLHWEMSVGGVLVDALRWTDGSQGF